MKNLLAKLIPADKSRFLASLAFIAAALVVSIVWDQRMRAKDEPLMRPEAESVETASTFIPDGFVLVPIEVANFESLDSILGKFGVVDLFVSSDDPLAKPRKIAERVKILRAPLNPSHFAVLVPDSESQKIVAYSGALTVVVQNPKRSGTSFVMPDDKTRCLAHRSRVTVEVQNAE